MSALKSIRDFKSTKVAAHDKVIDLVVTVQRGRTILESLGAVHELVGNRETLASIVQSLPSEVQSKWYDREVPEEETTLQKGEFLLVWLEKQRQNAVRFHLDTIATRMRTLTPGQTRPPASTDSTDKGLASSSLHTMTPGAESSKPKKPPGSQAGGVQNSGDHGDGAPGQIEVRTSQDALAVTARRKASLEAKKLDKCLVCGQIHTYERMPSHQ